MSERGWFVAFALFGALGLVACAAPKDAPVSGAAHEELRDQSTEAAAGEDMDDAAPPAEPAADQAEPEPAPKEEAETLSLRNIADVERELAANQARLRSLGVLPGGGSAAPTPTPAAKPDQKPTGDRPSTPQPSKPNPGKKGKAKEQDGSGGAGIRDEAKATGQRPNAGTDAIDRCESICALSQGTCELRGAICELADRHDEENDYRSACDRAGEDCEVAEEACRACAD